VFTVIEQNLKVAHDARNNDTTRRSGQPEFPLRASLLMFLVDPIYVSDL
jgi:hypothetical protein